MPVLVTLALAALLSAAPPPALLPRASLFADAAHLLPKVSPDGTRLGWLQPDERGILQVRVGDLEGGEARAVTQEARPVRRWAWSGDGREVLFLQDEGGDENAHLWSVTLATGQVRDLTPFRGVAVGDFSVGLAVPRQLSVQLNLRDRGIFDLYRLDLDTGAVVQDQVNPGTFAGFLLDPRLEARAALEFTKDGGSRIHVRDGAGWRPILSAPLDEALEPVSIAGDGARLLYLSSLDAPAARLVERDLATGAERVLAADAEADVVAVATDAATGAPLGAMSEHLRRRWTALDPGMGAALAAFRKLAPGADLAPLDGGTGVVDRDLAGRYVVASLVEDRAPARFALFDARAGTARWLFPPAAPAPRATLAAQDPVVIKARDGRALPSYLSLPPGVPPRRLPLVLLVHGGPSWRDSWGWHPITQWLVNRGYAVLRVNFRASTGFGKGHARAGNRQFGAAMQDDLSDAVAWAVTRGYADPKRVAIMGKSYGGYATLVGAALTPELYRCGVSYVGVADLASLVRSFPPYWQVAAAQIRALFGDPDDPRDLERMRSVSPVNLVERIAVPLLIGQGANDVRVRKEQADLIFEALDRRGLPATYVLYTDEGHGPPGVGPDSPANRTDWYGRVEAFLGECLGGRVEPLAGEREPGSSAVVRRSAAAAKAGGR